MQTKCQFNQGGNYIFEAVENDNFIKQKNNIIKLSVTHQYYYQIQTRIYVTKNNFCDFLYGRNIWYCYVERICPDDNLWSKIVSKRNHSF